MGTNNLKVKVVHLDDAPDYDEAEWQAIDMTDTLVIKEGTIQGNPTVDFRFKDKAGKKYIAMMTGGIIQNLAAIIEGAK